MGSLAPGLYCQWYENSYVLKLNRYKTDINWNEKSLTVRHENCFPLFTQSQNKNKKFCQKSVNLAWHFGLLEMPMDPIHFVDLI